MKTKLTTQTKPALKFNNDVKIIVGITIDPKNEYGGSFMPIEVLNNSLLFLDVTENGGYPEDHGFIPCREEFHEEYMNNWNKNKNILFTHNNKLNELSKFLSIIEDKLKIAKTKKSTVVKAHTKVALIQISDWWNVNHARQQFFTILIRAACNFNTKSKDSGEIERTLKSHEYFRDTYIAVDLFLRGYNKLSNSNFYGWDDTFCDLPKEDVLTILKK